VTNPAADARAIREDGYVKLPGVLATDELAALQAETRAQIDACPLRQPEADFRLKALPDGRTKFFRIQFLPDKQLVNDALLQVLGHQRILATVEAILGANWGFFGSAMVFKGEDGGAAIEAHRGDAATGALRVLRGSHTIEDVRHLAAAGINQLDLVEVPMEPGDVLIHDTMVLHGSPATPPGSPLRRVLDHSFSPSTGWHARVSSPASRSWTTGSSASSSWSRTRRGPS